MIKILKIVQINDLKLIINCLKWLEVVNIDQPWQDASWAEHYKSYKVAEYEYFLVTKMILESANGPHEQSSIFTNETFFLFILYFGSEKIVA